MVDDRSITKIILNYEPVSKTETGSFQLREQKSQMILNFEDVFGISFNATQSQLIIFILVGFFISLYV